MLKKDFGETLSDVVRVGIITAMMPQSVQEYIYTDWGQNRLRRDSPKDLSDCLQQGGHGEGASADGRRASAR